MASDMQQEQERSLAARRLQEQSTLAVSPPTFMTRTLTDARATTTSSVTAVRWDPAQPDRVSHLVCNRSQALDVYAVRWTKGDNSPASSSDGSMQVESSSWTLHFMSIAQPELIGICQQISVLPWSAANSAAPKQDLLLLTSDSGMLSVLAFESQGDPSSLVGRLRALGHTRIGAAGMGPKQLGTFLRVQTESPCAVAVASREATMTVGGSVGRGDGGVLVYPMVAEPPHTTAAATFVTPTSSAALGAPAAAAAAVPMDDATFQSAPLESQRSSPAASAASSSPVSSASASSTFAPVSPLLPHLLKPVEVPVDGVLTALLFLPPSANHPDRPRLLMSVVKRGNTVLMLVVVDFAKGSFAYAQMPVALPKNAVIMDMLLANPRAAPAASAAPLNQPCFVLLQLENQLVLFDVNGVVRIQIKLRMPGWADAADQVLQRSVGKTPLITGWSWVQDRRLTCVTETGDVHWLCLWWNTLPPGQTPALNAPLEQWMRFVPLGLATPSACMIALSAPSSSDADAADFLMLPGEGAEGMLLRVDWNCAQEQSGASSISAAPLESALQRERHLPNLAPLFDWVAANATLRSALPSKHEQLYLCSGLGRHGALRIMRPNTLEAELIESEEAATDNKIFQQLLPLRAFNAASQRTETVALVYSFVGSSRIRALIHGELADVSDAVAAGGFELGRTTLDAALVADERVLLQVDDRVVRALSMQPRTNQGFATKQQIASWSPEPAGSATTAASSAAALFTLAHISNDFILLSLPASRSVVLIQLCLNAANGTGIFVVRGQTQIDSDVSAVQIARIGADLLCMVATHDCKLSFFKAAPMANDAAPAPDLLLFRLQNLKTLLPSSKQTDLSSVAESMLLCTAPASAPPSTPAHLFLGLRDGNVLRCSLFPNATAASAAAPAPSSSSVASASSPDDGFLRECIVRRLGSARVKLMRLEGAGVSASGDVSILAMCDQTFVLNSPQPHASEATVRHSPLRIREWVWSWSTNFSSVVQFAAPFAHADMPNGVACVINGVFKMAEIDPSRSEPSISKPIMLRATPRRVVYHAQSNSICIITLDQSDAGSFSKLIIVDPLSGAIKAQVACDAAHSLIVLPRSHPSSPLLVVGCSSMKGAADPTPVAKLMYFELLDSQPAPVAAASADSSATPVLMDLTEGSQSSLAAAAPAAAASSSVVRCVHEWLGPPGSGRVSSLCVWRPFVLLAGTDTDMFILQPVTATPASSSSAAAAPAPLEFKRILATKAPYPVWHLDTVVSWAVATGESVSGKKPERFVMIDQRQGAQLWTVQTLTPAERASSGGAKRPGAWFKLLQSDPYARVARQAVLYETRAGMQPVHTLSPHQAGNPITVSAAVAAAPPHDVHILRMVGIDVFGRIFVLRQDPADETALVGHKPATAAAGAQVPSAGAAAASSSASAAKSALPSNVVSTSLVQEACFQLGSTPSRIRMLPRPQVKQPLFLVSSLLGSMHAVRELTAEQSAWLRALQQQLAGHSACRSLVGNHHASYRSQTGVSGGGGSDSEQMIDGDLIATFFTLSLTQQQQVCSRLPKLSNGAERVAWKVQDELDRLLHVDI